MASQDTRALWLPDESAFGPPSAFIDDHEFCHVHALPEGSLHMTLPSGVRERMIGLAWGEQHPGAEAGFLAETLVMVYAPRDHHELAIVFGLLKASYEFARGASR
jgi:phospholipase/carboxylesterase